MSGILQLSEGLPPVLGTGDRLPPSLSHTPHTQVLIPGWMPCGFLSAWEHCKNCLVRGTQTRVFPALPTPSFSCPSGIFYTYSINRQAATGVRREGGRKREQEGEGVREGKHSDSQMGIFHQSWSGHRVHITSPKGKGRNITSENHHHTSVVLLQFYPYYNVFSLSTLHQATSPSYLC